MQKKILLLIFFCFTLTLSAQKYTGIVRNSKGGVVEFASIMLVNQTDSNQFVGTSADIDGKFEFNSITYPGFYIVSSSIGFDTKKIGPFNKSFSDSIIIVMNEATATINEFTLESKVNKIEIEPGKIIMNVENSTLSTGNTALDLLRRIPGVFVDNDGNISVKGKNDVMVYVDGKPTYLSGSLLKNFLKTLSASNISKIEVITQPGANYDAEGNAGIIDIKLKRKMALGFNGTLDAWYAQGFYPKAGGSFNFNYGKGKWNINGSYSYSHWHGYIQPLLSRVIDSALYSQDYWGTPIENSHSVVFNMDYEINKKWSIGSGLTFNAGHNQWLGSTKSTFSNLINSQVDSVQIVKDDTRWTNFNGTVNLNTQWKIDSLDQKLSINVDGGIYTEQTGGIYQYRFLNPLGDTIRTSPNRNYMQDPKLFLVSGKLDYVNPHLAKGLELMAGIKSSYVTNDANVQYTTYDSGNNEINIPELTNHFIYEENINAIYLSLKYKIKKWSFSAGLRGEHTNTTGRQLTTGQLNRQNYFSLFPNAGIAFNPNDNHSITFMYSRRIDRPEYNELNPFIYMLDNYSSYQGNPNLLPQFSNNFELSYTMFEIFTLNATYSLINNNITDVFRFDSLFTQRLIYTNANIGETHTFNAGGSLMMPIGKWCFMMLTGSAIYNSVIDSSLNIDRAGWYGMFSGYFEFYLPAKFTIELNAYMMTQQPNGQQITLPFGEVSAGISKKLFKDQLTLKFNVSDIFRTTQFRSITQTQYGDEFNSSFWWDSRVFTFSASFNFGKSFKEKTEKDKDAIFDRVGGGR